MDVDMVKIVDKIKKLLALSGSSNENEASSALAHAHELLQKYNLSMDSISLDIKIELSDEPYFSGNTIHAWRSILLNSIAKYNYCSTYTNITGVSRSDVSRNVTNRSLHLVGKEHNVEACKVMADYIFEAIEKGAKINMKGKGRDIVASYKMGFANAISNRLSVLRLEEEANTECTSLVVTSKKEINDYFSSMKMKTTKTKSTISNPSGYYAGALDGSKLSLNLQVT